ncbi:hypothetical protein ABK040_014879 [Willaertia magna]
MDFVDMVCCLRFPPNHVLKSYRTDSHLEMYRILSTFCYHSNALSFKHKRGAGSYCLVGNRGIGMSATLVNFTAICEHIYPKVIPIYISYHNVSKCRYLQELSILDIAHDVLIEKGYSFRPEGTPFMQILNVLKRNDKRIVIFVDEIDALYTVDPTTNLIIANHVVSVLAELATIGNDDSGLISALLCGSSSMIELLISNEARLYPSVSSTFPLANVSPNMNRTKFRALRIRSFPPTCVDVARKVLNTLDEGLIKVATFVTGAIPRHLHQFMLLNILGTRPINPLTLDPRLEKLKDDLYNLLFSKNDTLMNSLCTNGELDIEKVKTGDWVEGFKPLSPVDINVSFTFTDLLTLNDNNYITLVGQAPHYLIYPVNMYSLFLSKYGVDSATVNFMAETRKAIEGYVPAPIVEKKKRNGLSSIYTLLFKL